MTTIEHLQRIKSRCQELLATAETRTPGRWRHNEGRRMQLSALTMHQDPVLHGDEYLLSGPDGDFIASCAGPAEAGWRATIAICDELLRILTTMPWGTEAYQWADDYVEEFLLTWPEEVLA